MPTQPQQPHTDAQQARPYANIIIKDTAPSEKEITGELDPATIERFRSTALKKINARLAVPGFRKGNIPENVIISSIGTAGVWEEMIECAFREIYPSIITDHALVCIGEPTVQFADNSEGNPLRFTINTAILPDIILPDYKKIAHTINEKDGADETITQEELDKALLQIKRMRAYGEAKTDEERQEVVTASEDKLPTLDLDYIKTIGSFESIDHFTERLTQQVQAEKNKRKREKRRSEIGNALVDTISADIPRILVDGEIDRMVSQLAFDLNRMNRKIDDYCQEIGKTVADIREEFKDEAKKRTQLQLSLNKIARIEQIMPTQEELDIEIKKVLAHHKTAKEENIRDYVALVLMNEKVFQMLEEQ